MKRNFGLLSEIEKEITDVQYDETESHWFKVLTESTFGLRVKDWPLEPLIMSTIALGLELTEPQLNIYDKL